MSGTSIRQRFSIATVNPDGSETLTPMKTWLRHHPEGAPEGVDFDGKHSRYIIRRLLAHGWSSQETPEEIRLFPPGAPPPDIEEDEPDEGADPGYGSFRMETELRDFLANNLNLVKINESRLRLYIDQHQRNGVEYPTATGPIDILAIDDTGAFYIFELKRAVSPDSAIGQINPTVTEAIRRLDWKVTAFYTALALVLIGMAGIGGYYQGRADGYEAGYSVSQNKMVDITLGTTVAATLPAPKAEQWLRLIHLNGDHIDEAWNRCIASQQEGRMACEFPFWITSAPVPHVEQATPPPTTPKKAGSK